MNGNEHATRMSGTTDRSPTEEVEVAVVGAGPTGLALAVMLSSYGIQTAVLEGAAGPAPHTRAAVVHARTLETLEPLGVVGEMLGGRVLWEHEALGLGQGEGGVELVVRGARGRGGCGLATSSAATAGAASRGE